MNRRRLAAALLVCSAGNALAWNAVDARLAEYRTQIDGIDRQIAQLLNQRVSVVRRIGIMKKQTGLAVAAPARDRAPHLRNHPARDALLGNRSDCREIRELAGA